MYIFNNFLYMSIPDAIVKAQEAIKNRLGDNVPLTSYVTAQPQSRIRNASYSEKFTDK